MNRILILPIILLLALSTKAQQLMVGAATPTSLRQPKGWGDEDNPKPKPINYNAIGYLAPLNMKDLVVGGTSVVYKRFGTFLAYKAGIRNWMMPEGEKGDITYDNAKKYPTSYPMTGNSQKATTFMLSGGLAFCFWKKMPIYVGVGATRYRAFYEYLDRFDSYKPKWNVNTDETGFQLNYTAGFFLPLFGRLVLNAGYDHNPQSVFVGIAIRGKDVYEDIDEW